MSYIYDNGLDLGVGEAKYYRNDTQTEFKAEMNWWDQFPPDPNNFQGPIDYLPAWNGENNPLIPENVLKAEMLVSSFDEQLNRIIQCFKNKDFRSIPGLCNAFLNRNRNNNQNHIALVYW